MCNKLGAQKTVIIGSIIAGCAFILATISPNLIVFLSIYGILGGIGFGMIYLPAIVSVGQYFESKRAIATGIAVAGSGVGTMLMPFVARFAIQNLAWKGADLVLASLIFLCIISGLLYRKLTPPALSKKDSTKVKEPEKEHEDKEMEKMKDALSHCEDDESVFAESWAKSSNDMPMGRIRNELSQCDEDDEMSFAKSWANRQKMPSDAERRPSVGGLSQCDENEEMSFAQSWAKAIADRKQKTNNPLSRVRNELSHSEDGGDKGFAKSWAGQKARRTTTVRQRKLTLTGVNEELTQPKGDLAKSIRELRINLTPHEVEEIAKPLNRQDIMYTGSLKKLNRYRKEGGGLSYRASITTIPKTVIEETPLVDEEEKRKCKLCPSFLGDIIDFELLKNPIMLLLCLSNLLASLAYFTPFVFLKDLAISKGIPEKDTMYFVPLIGVTNTVGRILSGWLADRQFVSSLTIVTFSQLICGLLCLAAPFCHSYSMLLVYGALFGFIISAYICLSSIVLADLLGIERLTSSFGLLAVSRGIACLLGTPFAGLAFDLTRSYDVCFYVGGAVLVAASSVSTIIPIVRRYRSSRKVHSEGENVEGSTE